MTESEMRYVAFLEAEIASWMEDRGDEDDVSDRLAELRRAAEANEAPEAYRSDEMRWRKNE